MGVTPITASSILPRSCITGLTLVRVARIAAQEISSRRYEAVTGTVRCWETADVAVTAVYPSAAQRVVLVAAVTVGITALGIMALLGVIGADIVRRVIIGVGGVLTAAFLVPLAVKR